MPTLRLERIRRFVKDALPELLIQVSSGECSEEQLSVTIKEAIENPTERMRKAYRKLEEAQQYLLISMLDCDRSRPSKN